MATFKLPPNRGTRAIKNILIVDTETYFDPDTAYLGPQLHTLRLGCAIRGRYENGRLTRRKEFRFKTQREFWDWFIESASSRDVNYIFGHNIGFDLAILHFPELVESREFQFYAGESEPNREDQLGRRYRREEGFLCIDAPPLIITCRHCSGPKVTFIDTMNFWVTSLAKLGELFGTPKGAVDFRTVSDPDLSDYCLADCRVVEKAVCSLLDWVQREDMGQFRMTAPALAMGAFRHRFNAEKVTTHDNADCRQLEREAYYGGRLELFFIGEVNQPIHELDVTSLYPSVMKGNLYPRQLKSYYTPERKEHYRKCPRTIDCIAEVLLRVESDGFPMRNESGTIYPVGRYWTTLAGPELIRAENQGVIEQVGRWAEFELAPIFDEFVTHFWEYRKQQMIDGNKVAADFAKLMMNSLYGKFGQCIDGWEWLPEWIPRSSFDSWDDFVPKFNRRCDLRSIGPFVQVQTEKHEHPQASPAIAAYVTSYARERMRRLKMIAGNSEVYYLVTDALFVSDLGLQRLKNAGEIGDKTLGKLAVKRSESYGWFTSLHQYGLGEHRKRGSLKSKAVPIPDGNWVELHFARLDAILKTKPAGGVWVTPRRKEFRLDYERGVRSESGRVSPLIMETDNAKVNRIHGGNP